MKSDFMRVDEVVTELDISRPFASMMFSLPMLTDTMKNRSSKKNMAAFVIACLFVAVYGYNRIHMTNHFLSDVCFGTLITYIIYAVISTAFMKAAEK